MSSARQGLRSSILVSPYFWVPVAFGSLLIALAATDVPALALALLGAGLATAGSFVLYFRHARPRTDPNENRTTADFADNNELTRLYRVVGEALATVAAQPEGDHKDAATQKLVALGVQFRAVATGAGARGGIESWYVAHDAVLAGPDLREYRAVVQVRAECARSSAVQESLRATFAAVRRGVLVERILVLPDALWPMDRLLPTDDVLPWIEEQHGQGLRVVLVRERDLTTEPSLPIDTCVFDDWAVGTRTLSDGSRTACVALDFDPVTVRATRDWSGRLSNLGISFRDLLDRAEAGD